MAAVCGTLPILQLNMYICMAWRAGVRRVCGLPGTTHCALLPLITSRLPIMDEIVKHGGIRAKVFVE